MMETLFAVIAFAGGVVSILGGWLASEEPWNNRKALGSLGAILVYSVSVGMASSGQVLNWFVGGTVFLSAIAVNFWGKNLWDILKVVWEKTPTA